VNGKQAYFSLNFKIQSYSSRLISGNDIYHKQISMHNLGIHQEPRKIVPARHAAADLTKFVRQRGIIELGLFCVVSIS
jgi:hypothetical protein